ncbi:MAG: hypothetical protein DLM60_05990 [Pseudonocardiales bacterium]|nr:MAG: hypothetical protein DLM60_05990 [Pseudonocardiales bacterium]
MLVKDGLCYVVFDNLRYLALFDEQLLDKQLLDERTAMQDGQHALVELIGGHGKDYEDIAYDRVARRFYVLIEAQPYGAQFMATVEEYDEQFRMVSSMPLDFPLVRPNKGLEGLTCIRRDGKTHLLGLCEGNRCKAGSAGRTPGGGRIQIFVNGADRWTRVGTIRLPETLRFRDYSGLSVAEDRIAVVSQESSALWVGQFAAESWKLADEGTIYRFPRDEAGKKLYCNVEGVSWVAHDRVVIVSDRAKTRTQPKRCRAKDESIGIFTIPGLPEATIGARTHAAATDQRRNASPFAVPAVRGLFQQRVSGDDALLRLAQLRFAQAGLAAEVYAGTPDELDWILAFAPAHPELPVVHLDRRIDVLDERGAAVVADFATRFVGRVAGLVVHDKPAMADRVPDVVAALRALGGRPERPQVFLEYAAGMELERFAEIGEGLRDVEGVSLCIDSGHVGIKLARVRFAKRHDGLALRTLSPADPRLPALIEDVQAAVDSALPAVLELTRTLGGFGKTVHFHLHDGHPLIPGLSDHFSFLTRVPIPFVHDGRCSLPPLYGPTGLAQILRTAVESCGADRASITLEIHQAEGRLPLGDAAELFGHWRDLTNAERMNYWLSVIAQNHELAIDALVSA